MSREYLKTACPPLRDFLVYNESVRGRSELTIEQYNMDLTLFFKYLKRERGLVGDDVPFSDINVSDVDIELLRSVTVTDLYAFIVFCKDERLNDTSTRARKISSLRSFFKYLNEKVHLIESNPANGLNSPKLRKALPVHLTLDQSLELLQAVDGPNKERDYCILTLFLNCGMRLSELCSINYTDIKPDGSLKILGKGNKERMVFLNDACKAAIDNYMKVRPADQVKREDRYALFLSSTRRSRISPKTVQFIVKKYIDKAGLEGQHFSTHKLRHTAATLMYQMGGVDVRVLKEVLGHENLGTTQIYTHVSDAQIENAFKNNPLSEVKQKEKKDNNN